MEHFSTIREVFESHDPNPIIKNYAEFFKQKVGSEFEYFVDQMPGFTRKTKCTAEDIELYFNAAQAGRNYYYSQYGMHEDLMEINDMTKTKMTVDQLYSSNNLDIEEIRKKLYGIDNFTEDIFSYLEEISGINFRLIRYAYYEILRNILPKGKRYVNAEQKRLDSLMDGALR